jgi:hypothetical protein
MTGIKDFNFPAFFDMAAKLKAIGVDSENPADNDGPDLETALQNANNLNSAKTWQEYMRTDIRRVLDSDGIVVLPGWQQSRGAKLEVYIARTLHIPVFCWRNGLVPLLEVIGFSGYAQNGKDEASKFFVENGWRRASFADVIRKSLYELNPIIGTQNFTGNHGWGTRFERLREIIDQKGWETSKLSYLEVRNLLQRLGTDAGRNVLGENVWVDAVFNSLEEGQRYVFSDLRFPNEAEAIKSFGGKVIRIQRPGFGPINNHISEVALDGYEFDQVIVNDGTIEDFRNKLKGLL